MGAEKFAVAFDQIRKDLVEAFPLLGLTDGYWLVKAIFINTMYNSAKGNRPKGGMSRSNNTGLLKGRGGKGRRTSDQNREGRGRSNENRGGSGRDMDDEVRGGRRLSNNDQAPNERGPSNDDYARSGRSRGRSDSGREEREDGEIDQRQERDAELYRKRRGNRDHRGREEYNEIEVETREAGCRDAVRASSRSRPKASQQEGRMRSPAAIRRIIKKKDAKLRLPRASQSERSNLSLHQTSADGGQIVVRSAKTLPRKHGNKKYAAFSENAREFAEMERDEIERESNHYLPNHMEHDRELSEENSGPRDMIVTDHPIEPSTSIQSRQGSRETVQTVQNEKLRTESRPSRSQFMYARNSEEQERLDAFIDEELCDSNEEEFRDGFEYSRQRSGACKARKDGKKAGECVNERYEAEANRGERLKDNVKQETAGQSGHANGEARKDLNCRGSQKGRAIGNYAKERVANTARDDSTNSRMYRKRSLGPKLHLGSQLIAKPSAAGSTRLGDGGNTKDRCKRKDSAIVKFRKR